MNLGFVHPTYPQGEGTGATHSASRIALELADQGHDVTVYCREAPPADADHAAAPTDDRDAGSDADAADVIDADAAGAIDADLTLRSLDRGGYPYHSGLQFDRALRDRVAALGEHDLVHSYVMNAIPALGAVARETDAATVATLNAYGAVCPKNDLRYMDRESCTSNGLAKCTACSLATSGGHDEDGRAYRSASRLGYLKLIREGERVADRIDAYHCLSPHLARTYADFGFPEDRLDVIPNLLDERFCRPHESDFEPPYELLYVGSLAAHKGVDRLVPIVDDLNAASAAEYRLTVVGDGGRRSQIEGEADRRDLEDAVTVTGWLPNDELPGLYASHDCFVYPGRWAEPFGRVFLEALATGTPTVASDVGSVAEILGAGGRVTDGSVEAFVATIRSVLEDGDAEAVSNAATEAVDRYRADAVVPQFEALYEDALGG